MNWYYNIMLFHYLSGNYEDSASYRFYLFNLSMQWHFLNAYESISEYQNKFMFGAALLVSTYIYDCGRGGVIYLPERGKLVGMLIRVLT